MLLFQLVCGKTGLSWQQMNTTALEFPDEAFDAVIDKGTLDSILCGEGSTSNVGKALSEITRVLKPNGVLLMLSYGIPDNRLSYLDNDAYHWSVQVHTVQSQQLALLQARPSDANSVHYMYVCVILKAKHLLSSCVRSEADNQYEHHVGVDIFVETRGTSVVLFNKNKLKREDILIIYFLLHILFLTKLYTRYTMSMYA